MANLLIILAGLLLIISIVQVVRILELTSTLRGGDSASITDEDNSNQGLLMLLFLIFMMGSFIWSWMAWGDLLLPAASSIHGAQIDGLMAVTMGLILVVFFITQPLLFYFAYKYRGRKGNRAAYVSHNNKLELIWTSIPAVVLTALIAYGLSTWSSTMYAATDESEEIELYARQFDWTARYSGTDKTLGEANVRNIEGVNMVGVNPLDPSGDDDMLVRGEMHLVVGKPYLLKFRSQDVIHSAYLPHFRVQMNCVPGMTTQFAFTPTKTTAEMRQETGNEAFDYILLCNKICGSAHYNMQMTVIVESQEEYNTWLAEQKPLKTEE